MGDEQRSVHRRRILHACSLQRPVRPSQATCPRRGVKAGVRFYGIQAERRYKIMTRNLLRWFVLSGLTAAGLLAQGDRGTITGTVTDSSGQVVPNAEIVILNEGTGIQAATKTGDAGTYTIPLLSIGNHTLKVSIPGFKSYIRQAIPVQVSQTTRVDVQLEVGQVEEKITV